MIYWDIIRFSFLRFFAYPFEIIASTAKRAAEVVFLIIFWSIYAKSTSQEISIPQISAYFLIAMGIADLTMSRWGAFSSIIGSQVKSGQISNYMIKPTNLIWTLYSISLGRNGLRLMLAVINVVIGIAIYPPRSIGSVILFIVFFILSWFISFAYNLFEGTLYLHFTDASGIRNSLENFIRVFTGALIPIYLFPTRLREIVSFLPFPAMVYGPTNALTSSLSSINIVFDISVAVFWAIFLNVATRMWWNYSMKKYEAVGI